MLFSLRAVALSGVVLLPLVYATTTPRVYNSYWNVFMNPSSGELELQMEGMTHLTLFAVNMEAYNETSVFDANNAPTFPGYLASSSWPSGMSTVWNVATLKQKYSKSEALVAGSTVPKLKVLALFGGWGYDRPFRAFSKTDASRLAFAKAVLLFAQTNSLDGIDIDWEFPVDNGQFYHSILQPWPDDRGNFVSMIQAIKTNWASERTTDGVPYLLTVSIPVRFDDYHPFLDATTVPALTEAVDWFNLMVFDAINRRDGGKVASPHTGLKVLNDAATAFNGFGMSYSKMVMAMPMYAKGYPVPTCERGLNDAQCVLSPTSFMENSTGGDLGHLPVEYGNDVNAWVRDWRVSADVDAKALASWKLVSGNGTLDDTSKTRWAYEPTHLDSYDNSVAPLLWSWIDAGGIKAICDAMWSQNSNALYKVLGMAAFTLLGDSAGSPRFKAIKDCLASYSTFES